MARVQDWVQLRREEQWSPIRKRRQTNEIDFQLWPSCLPTNGREFESLRAHHFHFIQLQTSPTCDSSMVPHRRGCNENGTDHMTSLIGLSFARSRCSQTWWVSPAW